MAVLFHGLVWLLVGTVGFTQQIRIREVSKGTEVIVGLEEVQVLLAREDVIGLFPGVKPLHGVTGHQYEDQPDGGFARKYLAPQDPKKFPLVTGWTNPNTEAGHADGR
jgi:hypothetical protein